MLVTTYRPTFLFSLALLVLGSAGCGKTQQPEQAATNEMTQPSSEQSAPATLYKVLSADAWQQAELDGTFRGVGIDLEDGFIHLSAPDQVKEVVANFFANQDGLVLVSLDGDRLGESLRWEASSDGVLFPHVYGDIPLQAVKSVDPLPLGEDNVHQFPF
ncbi:MAG: DUF952 domain-containing protein [Rubripirellula sp.]|nr:DUF952 domain-containing protein [Rubripirellula sp.]